ncbi:MAG: hypothetical protein AAGA96_14965, partial [Verrucomicrobiota bacterium]
MTEKIDSGDCRRRSRKRWIGVGLTFALIISIYLLVVAHENWSGAREWKRVEQKLIDGGVELELADLIPEMPSPDQNFGSHPMVQALTEFEKVDGSVVHDQPELVEQFQQLRLPVIGSSGSPLPSWQTRKRGDLSILLEMLNDIELSNG